MGCRIWDMGYGIWNQPSLQPPYLNLHLPKQNTSMFRERSIFTSFCSDTEDVTEI